MLHVRARNRRSRPDGFAVPLAVVLLVALALLTALVLEAALGEFKTDVALLEESRAAAAVEGALATALVQRLDSAALHRPPGTVVARTFEAVDSVATTVQMLGSPLARVMASVVLRSSGVRAIAGRAAYVRLRVVPGNSAELALEPLTSFWWASTP